LLNALARSEVAIVTDEAGTTRDVREVPINVGGNLVLLLDTAGLRETQSKAESEGVRRAREEVEVADLVLWLVAPDLPDTDEGIPEHAWIVGTKSDLGGNAELAVSTLTGDGIDALLDRIKAFAVAQAGLGEPALLSHERDRDALRAADAALWEAAQQWRELELVAESLRGASAALERLLGRMDAEAVLDRLFLSFCIGK
jgi:tRNA modification GTPase